MGQADQAGWLAIPPGGHRTRESALEAAFRELYEEVGLESGDVKLLGNTVKWLRYDVPYATKHQSHPKNETISWAKTTVVFIQTPCQETSVRLDVTPTPEFDHWRWVDYWSPLEHIVKFKRRVYKQHSRTGAHVNA